MSNVHQIQPAQFSRVTPGRQDRAVPVPSESPTAAARREDRVDLSESAQALSNLGTDVRADLVARVKAQIAEGNYVTPERIDSAIDAIIAELDAE